MKDTNKHINNSILNGIKNNGFKNPDNYFESFEDNLFTKLSEESLPQQSGHKTPKDYFNNLEDEILQKINSSERQIKVISFTSKLKSYIPYAAAASILLFIGINYFSIHNNTINIEDISNNEIVSWLENNYEEINTNTLAEAFTEKDFSDNELINNVNINDTEIENYLNNVDSSVILNELN